MRRPDWDQWDRATIEELAALETFNTFEVCVLPPGKKVVGCRYVFKVKTTPQGNIESQTGHTGILTARGY